MLYPLVLVFQHLRIETVVAKEALWYNALVQHGKQPLEYVLSRQNLEPLRHYSQLVEEKGGQGVDGAETSQTTSSCTTNRLDNSLEHGTGSQQATVESILRVERERIATLLHDDVLQAFATCLLKAQLCERLAEMERYDQVRKELPLLEDALSDTIDRVRELAVMLKRPGNEPI